MKLWPRPPALFPGFRRPFIRRALAFAATGCFVLYAVVAAGLTLFQRSLLYNPSVVVTHPGEAGLPQARELSLLAADGERLVAWHVQAPPNRPVILYFHGNGGALVDRAPRFRAFAERGMGVLAVAYHGYGGSGGAPTQTALLADGESAFDEALRLGYRPQQIVVMGESLGSGVATMVAAHRQEAALILDSPYLSTLDVAERRYRLFPVGLLMLDTFRSDLAIARVNAPMLMIHATGDQIIPFASAQALFALAHEPKTLLIEPGPGHVVAGFPDIFPKMCAWIEEKTAASLKASREPDPAR